MFDYYLGYYDGMFVAKIAAMTENSAIDKIAKLVGVSASAYSGKARRLVTVVKL
jgi:hypothetical protein